MHSQISQYLSAETTWSSLREQPSDRFKLIVTSPPYNIGKSYESRSPLDRYLADQKEVIHECASASCILKGSICWQIGNYAEKGEISTVRLSAIPDIP